MQLTVVGAGLTGLVAAIDAADLGWDVTVLEARSGVGGRARTLEGPYRANRGPHALYTDGPVWSWLAQRDLMPPTVAPAGTTLFRGAGLVEDSFSGLRDALAVLPAAAPVDESYRDWASRYLHDRQLVEALTGLAFIVTFDHDPGRLSARFVHDRLCRGGSSVRYLTGGWGPMIDQLAEHAAALGVDICPGARVDAVPGGPTIIATTLSGARAITNDPGLAWTGTRAALFDFGLGPEAPVDWFRIFDLDQRIYAARYSAVDPSLAPEGHHLLQTAAALAPGERFSAAVGRVNELLNTTAPGWARHVRWRRAYELSDQTGAVDLPGTDWPDRPAVIRSPTLAVASDASAAPGLLSEVAHNAARQTIAAFANRLPVA